MGILVPIRSPLAQETAEHPFETASFFDCWWRTLAPKFRIRAWEGQLALVEKPVLKGVFQLKSLRIAGWNNYYYQSLSEERFDEFLRLSRRTPWDYLEINWNPAYTDEKGFDAFRAYGYEPVTLPATPCPVIDLRGGWEAYWQRKSADYRRDLSKKLKAAAPFSPKLTTFEGQNGITRFFERFIPLHIAYWQEKTGHSYLSDPREKEFLLQWCRHLLDAGHLQLSALRLDDEIVNLDLSIVLNHTRYCLLTINTGLHANLHPGLLAMHHLIADSCARGLAKIDLGPGDTHYKRKLATEFEQCRTTLVANPASLTGRLYVRHRHRPSARPAPANCNS